MEPSIIIISAIIVSVIIFFVFRFAILWYWKIDKMVSLLEGIEKHLKELKDFAYNENLTSSRVDSTIENEDLPDL
jgi:hypothetical protein